jgi:hypothetical protein
MQGDEITLLRELMAREQLNQLQMSVLAKVSQATVSRALSGIRKRRGKAHARLFTYVRAVLAEHAEAATGMKAVNRAFENIWDGSEVHASAVARVIDAMDGLLPRKD